MESSELYQAAYSLHYEKDDYDAAVAKYNEVIGQFPDSQEAGWAKTQLQNIDKMSDAQRFKTSNSEEAESTEKPTVVLSGPRFQTATGMGQTIAAVGWFILVASVVAALVLFVALKGVGILAGVAVLIMGCSLGLLTVVNGQLLQAVVSAENNTDKAAQLLEMLVVRYGQEDVSEPATESH